ncbi:MAG: hypothetical protein ACMG6H_11920, partial [Acidobacteriota bacterium]
MRSRRNALLHSGRNGRAVPFFSKMHPEHVAVPFDEPDHTLLGMPCVRPGYIARRIHSFLIPL